MRDSKLGAASHDPTAWARFARLTSACSRRLRRALGERIATLGLSETEFLLLLTCAESEESGGAQVELAARLGLSPAQISGVADRLRALGLIDAHRSARDRRRQEWRLSAAGRQRLAAACSGVAALSSQLDQKMSSDEQRQAEQFLERLARSAEEIERASDAAPEETGDIPNRAADKEAA